MAWVILFSILVLGFLGLLAWYRWRESQYLKKRTKEALSPSFRKELEKESQDALRRKKAFEEALKKFGL